jgi:hypothetical protein
VVVVVVSCFPEKNGLKKSFFLVINWKSLFILIQLNKNLFSACEKQGAVFNAGENKHTGVGRQSKYVKNPGNPILLKCKYGE